MEWKSTTDKINLDSEAAEQRNKLREVYNSQETIVGNPESNIDKFRLAMRELGLINISGCEFKMDNRDGGEPSDFRMTGQEDLEGKYGMNSGVLVVYGQKGEVWVGNATDIFPKYKEQLNMLMESIGGEPQDSDVPVPFGNYDGKVSLQQLLSIAQGGKYLTAGEGGSSRSVER